MRRVEDLLKSRKFWTAVIGIPVVIAMALFMILFGFNWWLTGSFGWGFLLSLVLVAILLGPVIFAALGTIGREGFDGSQFVGALKGSTALKASATLIGYLMIVRLWWAEGVPKIATLFTTSNYWIAILIAGIVLVLVTVALAGFLSRFSSGSNKKSFWAMISVAAIATILAFTSDKGTVEYYSHKDGTVLAKHCPNEQCPNPEESRVFIGEEGTWQNCPYCKTGLEDIDEEHVAKHLAAIEESKGQVYAPFKGVSSWWRERRERKERERQAVSRSATRPALRGPQPFVVETARVKVSSKPQGLFVPKSGDAIVYIYNGENPEEVLPCLFVQTEGGSELHLEDLEGDPFEGIDYVTVRRNRGGIHRIRLDPQSGLESVEIRAILIRHGTRLVDQAGWRGLVSLLVKAGSLRIPGQEPVRRNLTPGTHFVPRSRFTLTRAGIFRIPAPFFI